MAMDVDGRWRSVAAGVGHLHRGGGDGVQLQFAGRDQQRCGAERAGGGASAAVGWGHDVVVGVGAVVGCGVWLRTRGCCRFRRRPGRVWTWLSTACGRSAGVPQCRWRTHDERLRDHRPGDPSAAARRRARWCRNGERERVEPRRHRRARQLAGHAHPHRGLLAGPGGQASHRDRRDGGAVRPAPRPGDRGFRRTLELVTAPTFDPAPTDTCRIVDAGTRDGNFTSVSGAQVRPNKSYVASYDTTGVTSGVGLGAGQQHGAVDPHERRSRRYHLLRCGRVDGKPHLRLYMAAERHADRNRIDIHTGRRGRRAEHRLPGHGQQFERQHPGRLEHAHALGRAGATSASAVPTAAAPAAPTPAAPTPAAIAASSPGHRRDGQCVGGARHRHCAPPQRDHGPH